MSQKKTKQLFRYLHNSGRLSLLQEAVIHVNKYLTVLKDELLQLKKQLVSYRGNTLQLFNDVFSTYKIKFELIDKHSNNYSLIKGNCKGYHITIYVNDDFFIYTSKEMLDVYSEFSKQLLLLLSHELVHRGQYYVRKGDLINFYAFDGEDGINIDYIKLPQECMAYALMYIESLRYSGYTNIDILSMIKSGNLKKSQSLYIDFYISDLKKVDVKVYNRFLKYIYQYLNDPVTYDLKILV